MPYSHLKTIEGRKDAYLIIAQLPTQGHIGISFQAKGKKNGADYLLKLPNIANLGVDEIKRRLAAIETKFTQEARNGLRLQYVDNVAHVLSTDKFTCDVAGTPFIVPFLVQRFVEGTDLFDYLMANHSEIAHKSENPPQFLGLQSFPEWIGLAIAILEPLRSVHETGIVHGDLHLNNIRVAKENQKIVLIDFGESFLRDIEPHKSQSGYINAFTAPERRKKQSADGSSEPWEAPSDIFSYAIILYYLATGKLYVGEKIGEMLHHPSMEELHDYMQRCMRTDNQSFAEAYPCALHVILLSIHPNPHQRATARQLLDYLRVIQVASSRSPKASDFAPDVVLTNIANDERLIAATQESRLISELVRMNIERFGEKIRQLIHYGRVEVSGDRTELLNYLQQFLASLGPADTYWSVTHPMFWNSSNLGVRGRFYELNKILAIKGVAINRIFVVSDEEDEEAVAFRYKVLRVHRNLCLELESHGIEVRNTINTSCAYYTGLLRMPTNSAMNAHLKSGYLIGIASLGEDYFCLTFRSEGRMRLVRRLAIQRIPKEEFFSAIKRFESLAQAAVNVLDLDLSDDLAVC